MVASRALCTISCLQESIAGRLPAPRPRPGSSGGVSCFAWRASGRPGQLLPSGAMAKRTVALAVLGGIVALAAVLTFTAWGHGHPVASSTSGLLVLLVGLSALGVVDDHR